MLGFLFGAGSNQQYTIRIEGAEIKLNEEVLLPQIPRSVLHQRVTVPSVAILEGVRFVRVAAHLRKRGLRTIHENGREQDVTSEHLKVKGSFKSLKIYINILLNIKSQLPK